MKFLLLSLFAYLLGSIPSGYIIGKLRGIDIRTIGSKSTTSTNVSRALGWKWGVVSASCDVTKAVIPTFLAKIYLTDIWQTVIVALLPIIGHIFPVYLKFRGGKGAACFYGATLILTGPKFFLSVFSGWIIILLLVRIMSLTNILFSWLLAILLYFYFPLPYFVYGVLGAVIITFAMRENIKRMREGREPKASFKW
ncbi:glycerol-3-phosphate 1-O-acyltransferase PlsY [bacterium]|nr:glycerol-3-phosphate 1-O-acyltransferase PlsY [bacterium]